MIQNNNANAIWKQVLENTIKIGDFFTKNNINIACAESCTGGLVAAAFTSISGSSNWFDHGVVTYSNQSKIDLLSVAADTLNNHGAVSEATAGEMSAGLLISTSNINVGVSTTGIAGPTGAMPNKPVGTVCFGVSQRKGENIVTNTFTQYFDGNREEIRKKAVLFVTKLLQALEE